MVASLTRVGSGTGTTATVVATLAGGLTAPGILVADVGGNNYTSVSITDTDGSLVWQQPVINTTNRSISINYAVINSNIAAGLVITGTFNTSQSSGSMAIEYITGTDLSNPIDVTGANNGASSTSLTCSTSLANTNPNGLLYVAGRGNNNIAWDGTITPLAIVGFSRAGWKLIASSAIQTVTGTQSASVWAEVIACFPVPSIGLGVNMIQMNPLGFNRYGPILG